jgi:Regulator of ribonuclease activity B
MSLVEDLLANSARDTDLLKKNDARGDDFSKPRTVDFLFLTANRELADLVRDFVEDNQYGDAKVELVGEEFRILVQVFMPTTQQVLCSVSGLMACLAELYGVHYDGWGCVLQAD